MNAPATSLPTQSRRARSIQCWWSAHIPERIFELLGRKGEVAVDRLELLDTFHAALADYRQRNWDRAAKGFRDCLTIVPDDPPSQVFLDRINQFRAEAPAEDWDGVWALEAK